MIRVAPIAAKAARYAVEHWHYSQAMPVGRSVYFGVWENDRYIGVVIFGRGASPHLGTAYKLNVMQLVELTRVALTEHVAPVSQIVAEAIRQLRSRNPGLRLIVSFADPVHDHHGGIYQAMNWLYLGESAKTDMWRQIDGRLVHTRSYMDRRNRRKRELLHNRMVSKNDDGTLMQFGRRKTAVRKSDCEKVVVPGKHRYVLPLDRAMRRQLTPLALPYPRALDTRPGVDAEGDHADESSMGATSLPGS